MWTFFLVCMRAPDGRSWKAFSHKTVLVYICYSLTRTECVFWEGGWVCVSAYHRMCPLLCPRCQTVVLLCLRGIVALLQILITGGDCLRHTHTHTLTIVNHLRSICPAEIPSCSLNYAFSLKLFLIIIAGGKLVSSSVVKPKQIQYVCVSVWSK